jgi:hypothetical protein
VKGRALLDTLGMLRERLGEEALQRAIDTLGPEVRQVLRGKVLASDWFPLDLMTGLVAAAVAPLQDGRDELVRSRAEEVIARHLGGVYQLFIRLGSPEWLITRIASVHETYFRNVEIVPSFRGDRHATVRYVGFCPRHRIMEPIIVGFYRKALELSGAAEREVRIATSIAAGQGHFELELSW